MTSLSLDLHHDYHRDTHLERCMFPSLARLGDVETTVSSLTSFDLSSSSVDLPTTAPIPTFLRGDINSTLESFATLIDLLCKSFLSENM